MTVRSFISGLGSALVLLGAASLLLFAIGPHTGAYRTVSILSGSMEPAFSPGDVIISRPVRSDALRTGDVITFHAPVAGRPAVTHRIIEVSRDDGRPVIRTRGDANDAADPWDARLDGDVAWKQVAVVPYAGTVLTRLRSDHARTMVRYGAPSLFVVLVLISIWSPKPRRQTAERIELRAIIEAVQADLTEPVQRDRERVDLAA